MSRVQDSESRTDVCLESKLKDADTRECMDIRGSLPPNGCGVIIVRRDSDTGRWFIILTTRLLRFTYEM